MRKPPWQRIAVLAGLFALLVLMPAAPAQATITNVVPFNGAGEPIIGDAVFDNDELWAYVTSPSGGMVCVHKVTESPASCDDADSWGKTPVGPFYAGTTPVKAGKLPPGEWMMIAAEASGEPVTAVSEPFTVVPCLTCTPESYTKSPNFAAQSQNLLNAIKYTCTAVKAMSVLWNARDVYFAMQVSWAFTGGLSMGASIVTTAAGTGRAAFSAANAAIGALPGPFSLIANGLCLGVGGIPFVPNTGLADWVERWANDPPDPQFTEVAPPDFFDFDGTPGVPDDGLDEERRAIDAARALSRSTLTAFERFQGAEAASSMSHQHAQSRALGDGLFGYRSELENVADFLNETADEIRTEFPDPADRTMPQSDLDTADAFIDRVRDSGLLPEEIGDLHAAGLNDDSIARLRADMTQWDPSDITGPVVLDEAFDQLATAMRDIQPVAEDFAAEAAVYAGRSNEPPQAFFSVGAAQGAGLLTVPFTDASVNPDKDPLTISWDFGDGTTGTSSAGATVNHHYAAPGTYTVTQTVSDGYGTVTQTAQATAGPPNAPPVASFTATPQSGEGPIEVSFDASASTDTDGTIESYEWEFGDGQLGSGVAPKHTYDTASPQSVYTALLTVTDDDDATHSVTKQITVNFPAAPPLPGDDALDAAPVGVLDVLANDMDPDGDRLSVVGHGSPAHGSVACSTAGACRYDATGGYLGPDAFTYTVRDSDGEQATAQVAVTVLEPPPSGAPVAHDDDAFTRPATKVDVDVLENDTGTPPLTVGDVTVAGHGTATCSPAGACSYTPAAGFSGRDGFRYTITNGDDLSSTAEVHVTVAPPTAGFGATVTGTPDPLTSGGDASWRVGVLGLPAGVSGDDLRALPRPEVTATLTGEHRIAAGSVRAAPGWTAGPTDPAGRSASAQAGDGALLGASVTQAISRPLPPVSQGTGGDGHVPIVVGSEVFAFFHHSLPTQVTCIDRTTGARCPGYPRTLNMGTTDIPGPAAVVDGRIYVHLLAAGNNAAQTAPLSMFCWDTVADRPCGLIILDRFASNIEPGGSAPVLVGGKIYLAGDGGKLYCVDPALNAPCAQPPIPTGLATDIAGNYDIVSHGSRVYALRQGDKAVCIDVVARAACPGWGTPKPVTLGNTNLINRRDAQGAAIGVCLVIGIFESQCFDDANPGQAIPIAWEAGADFYSVSAEAEAGTRTLVGRHGQSGLACWDWVTMAPCAGGGYDTSGWLMEGAGGDPLPIAYGAAFDGSCAMGLGDPGLLFTVDPRGFSPCTSLKATRTIDLRAQRCDGTVGGARWTQATLEDTKPGELSSVVVTVRDAQTDAVLLTKELVDGAVDLSAIDAAAHPAITVGVSAPANAAGEPAWADAVPPRIRISWHADPKQLCFETTSQRSCSASSPVAVAATLAGSAAREEKSLAVQRPADCPAPAAPAPPRSEVLADAAALLLACSDRRIVLEDVYPEGRRVRLIGVADKQFAGKTVSLVFAATGKTVARAKVQPDGSFSATAPLPAAKLRNSNKARYQAQIGAQRSLNLKLARRLLVTSVKAAGGMVTIKGRVVGPLAASAKDRVIALQQVLACSKTKRIATVKPRANGSFAVTVPAPGGQRAAVYRLSTRVRESTRAKRLTETFTLPRAVDF